MSRIRILDDITAGRIAAGEVVERPVSVVKELVENSLDAGADQVVIEITEGGKESITVTDNGCGMSQEEVSLAFCRHATSKITCAEDLYSLKTLGFRGEALPSIASVSHLVLKTKMHSETVGHRIELMGGKVLSLKPVGCSPGTSVMVTDLFYNTPARRKHLKSKGTEAGLVVDMVQNISLARPGVRFLLRHNNRVIFRTPGSGRLVDAVSSVHGVEVTREMVEIRAEKGNVSLTGFVSKPSLNRKTRSHITFAVNGRYVRSKFINRAIEEAYSGLIPSGRYPVVVLSLELEPAMIDVNIHPAKMEVKINNENEIAKFIKDTIRKHLQSSDLILNYNYKIRSNTEKYYYVQNIPVNASGTAGQGSLELEAGQIGEGIDIGKWDLLNKQKINDQTLLPVNVKEEQEALRQPCANTKSKVNGKVSNFPFLQVIGQLLPTYIIAGGPDGLYILDQHAAHERIIFEELLNSVNNGGNHAQMLLRPVPLELNYKALTVLQENLNNFKTLGFILEEFGSGTYILRGIPANLSTEKAVYQFIDLLDELAVTGREESYGDFNRAIVTRLACQAAIKSGEKLSLEAMNAIVQKLSRVNEPYTCPHGRPTLVKITERELAQMFKRTN